jgi:RNase P/RNase MRP subunit POP5
VQDTPASKFDHILPALTCVSSINQNRLIFHKMNISTVARKCRPEKKQTGWCSDNETGGGDGKAER